MSSSLTNVLTPKSYNFVLLKIKLDVKLIHMLNVILVFTDVVVMLQTNAVTAANSAANVTQSANTGRCIYLLIALMS